MIPDSNYQTLLNAATILDNLMKSNALEYLGKQFEILCCIIFQGMENLFYFLLLDFFFMIVKDIMHCNNACNISEEADATSSL